MLQPMMGMRKLLVLEMNCGMGCQQQHELSCRRLERHLERPAQVEEGVDIQVALVVGDEHGGLVVGWQVLQPANLDGVEEARGADGPEVVDKVQRRSAVLVKRELEGCDEEHGDEERQREQHGHSVEGERAQPRGKQRER